MANMAETKPSSNPTYHNTASCEGGNESAEVAYFRMAAAISGIGADELISGRPGIIYGRYHEIMRRILIENKFTEAELNSLRDCCNGTSFLDALHIFGAVQENFEDSLVDGLAEKWGIDPIALTSKLSELNYFEQVALVESIEKYWRY
jgi:hypothetical protein